MAANLGYLFYREYYRDYFREHLYEKRPRESETQLKDRQSLHFKQQNEMLFTAAKKIVGIGPLPIESDPYFRMQTSYPGLLIGSGYSFGTGSEGEIKLGFYFDYTSGLPIIPGSSVKGLLRSIFTNFTDKEMERRFNLEDEHYVNLTGLGSKQAAKRVEQREELRQKIEKAAYTWWMVFQEDKTDFTFEDYFKLYLIEQAIFESRNCAWLQAESDKKRDLDEFVPVYKRDIFHDAYILNTYHTEGRVLASDFITPHKHKDRNKLHLDPFSNPVPVMFLKVLPNVEFQFCFDLKDGNSMSLGFDISQKKALFKRTIETLGIGAKTNVGYGQFTDSIKSHSSKKKLSVSPEQLRHVPTEVWAKLKKNTQWPGTVSVMEENNVVEFTVDKIVCRLSKPNSKNPELQSGDAVIIFFNNDYNDKSPNFKIKKA